MFFKYGGEHSHDDYNEFVGDDLDMMGESGCVIPIQGWYDWKEAVHKAAEKYRIQKIKEALPEAFDQYKMRVDTNIPFETSAEPIDYTDGYGNCILKGRVLAGEPRDFNF